MKEEEIDKWFTGLSVIQKNHIATKLRSKAEGRVVNVGYPECSNVWNELSLETKSKVYEHCLNDHNFKHLTWNEGRTMSY